MASLLGGKRSSTAIPFRLRRLRALASLCVRPKRFGDAERLWFIEHYYQAPYEIGSYLAASGYELSGKAVADVGCGDGIMALGICSAFRPERVVGFDIDPVDTALLLRRAKRYSTRCAALPDSLVFKQSKPTELPAAEGRFDAIYSWSVFEHVDDAQGLLREMRRILRPGGPLMLQILPLYHSEHGSPEHGSHLQPWYPDETFIQFAHDEAEILSRLRDAGEEHMLQEYPSLNRITVDALGDTLAAAGFDARRLELLTEPAVLPKGLSRDHPLSALGIAGVQRIAV